nr:transcription-repair coupling factor [Gammaproteobacteria bacterium]
MLSPAYRSPLTPDLPANAGERKRWGRLYGSSLGLVIGRTVEQHHGPVMVVTPDTPSAHRLEEELRFFLTESASILHFPDWETLPYDLFSPHQDIISERLTTLYRLPTVERGVLIVPVNTLMVRLAPRQYLEANSLVLNRGQRLNLADMRRRLEAGGYRCVSQVMEHGEFAVRGSVFDLYPMGSALPYRIDLFDDEIESIRTFDADTQRSQAKVDRIGLLPAREFPFHEEAVARFRQRWRARFEGDPTACPVYRDVSD